MIPEVHPGSAGAAREAVDNASAELRAAIRAEDYETAGRLMVEITEALATDPAASNPGEGQRALAETMSLLLWAKKVILTNRAHLQEKLRKAGQVGGYQSYRGAGQSRTWLLRG